MDKTDENPVKRSNCSTTVTKNFEPSDDDLNNYLWLKNNSSPESFVIEKWCSTYNMRRNDVLDSTINLFERWPIFKQKIAVSLVSFIYFVV